MASSPDMIWSGIWAGRRRPQADPRRKSRFGAGRSSVGRDQALVERLMPPGRTLELGRVLINSVCLLRSESDRNTVCREMTRCHGLREHSGRLRGVLDRLAIFKRTQVKESD